MAKPMGTFIEKGRQENCPYCHDLINRGKPLDKTPKGDCWLDMTNNGYFEYKVGSHLIVGSQPFNYCPMCGRDLRGDDK